MDFLKGWKTVLFNAAIVFVTMGLEGVAGYDWVAHVGTEWAVMIVAVVNMILRWVTTTPIFHGE